MKKYLKDTRYMYVITFVFCFMLFLYEPLTMYLSNTADFWFGLSIMFKMSAWLFFIVFIIISIGFNIVYFLNKNKDKKIFKICTIIMFIVFVCSYIQGNYLVGNLPLLDGTKIEWSSYKLDWLISLVLWIVVIVGVVLLIKKFSLSKMVKYSGYVSIAVFTMISLSFLTKYLTTNEKMEKDFISLATYKDITKYSSDENFIIFLLDCTDSKSYMNRLNMDDDFKDMLKDFTYYPDMMGAYPGTTYALPLILAGEHYQLQGPLIEWTTEAYKKSPLFDMLEKKDYELDIYEADLMYNDESASRINNVVDYSKSTNLISTKKFWKQEIKYILFRYLPSFLKKYSKVEDMRFDSVGINGENTDSNTRFFEYSNIEMRKIIQNDKIETADNKIFKFIHLKGAHAMFNVDKNYNPISNGTYDDGIDSALTITKDYLEKLKENNVYDNSTIIIMADHGFATENNGNSRGNPIFFIKSVGDKNNKMKTSNKALHFDDLADLYKDILDGKKTDDLFKTVPEKRARLYYRSEENNTIMIEYETKGKAWDGENALKKTGKVFKKEW